MNLTQYILENWSIIKNWISKIKIFLSLTSLMVGLLLIGITYDENRYDRRTTGTIIGMMPDNSWEVEYNIKNGTERGVLYGNNDKQIGDKVIVYYSIANYGPRLQRLSSHFDFFPIQGILISLTLAFLFSIRSGMIKCLSKMFLMRKRFAFLWLALNAILLIMSVYKVTGIEDYVYKMLSGIVLFGVNAILLIVLLVKTPS